MARSLASVAAVSAILVAGVGVVPAASAATVHGTSGIRPMNFTSNLDQVLPGFESRRWGDDSYTQIQFTGCRSDTNHSVTIELRRDINNAPDKSYGKKTLTNCFTGANKTSNAEWNNLPSGLYFFKITDVDNSAFTDYLSVSKVYQDTTKAD